MTKYVTGSDGRRANHLLQGDNQQVAVGAVAAQPTNPLGASAKLLRLVSTTPCHYAIGANPTAVQTDAFLPADIIEHVGVAPGDTISIIEDTGGSGGIITVTEAGPSAEPPAPTFSVPVQAVIDRMSALSQTEIDAIEAYVDGLVADGAYSDITEIYAPCLTATDYHTGFKFMTLIDSAAPGVHTPGEFVDFQTGSQHMLDSAPFDTFATVQGFMGAYIVFTAADSASNSDLFGIATAGIECYMRWRGNDTNDFNSIYNVTSATPRSVSQVRPTGDLVGQGLEGTDVFELMPGGIINKSTRVPNANVPATHPCQWHGQNIDGTPAAGNLQNSRYSLMIHSNVIISTVVQGVVRARSLQFLRDIGVTGIPVT